MAKKSLNDYYLEVREKNIKIREERKREIYSKIPEMTQLDYEMRKIGIDLAMKAFDSRDLSDDEIDDFVEKSKKNLENLKLKRAVILTDNDYPHDYLDEIFDCNECKDRGFVGSVPCKCYYENKIKMTDSLELWNKLKKENFDTFNFLLFSAKELDDNHPLKSSTTLNLRDYMKSVVRVLKDFIDFSDTSGIYLYGHTGVGKTFLCSCMAQYAIEKGKSVEYYSMNSLYEVIRAYKFDFDGKDYENIRVYKDIFKCDVLIIDDLGTEMKNSFICAELFSIINDRMVAGRKTIISSNMDPDDIAEQYDERIASRVIGTYSLILIDGIDIRQS